MIRGLDILLDTDLRSQITKIKSPILWLLGEKDKLVPSTINQYLKACVSQAHIKILDDATHVPFVSHPEHFVKTLTTFISDAQGTICPILENKCNQFNKAQIIRSFNRAANSYNQANILQKKTGDRLFHWLNFASKPFTIIDLGCGTGILTAKLARTFPKTEVIGLDVANNMIKHARECFNREKNLSFWNTDADSLPIASNSIDIAFSNLMLQWSVDIKVTLAEWFRILKPGGFLLLSTIGPDSLQELRDAWLKIDNHKHVNDFISEKQLLITIKNIGFKIQRFEKNNFCRLFNSIYELMSELKMLGASNLQNNRQRGLLGKNKLKKLQVFYEKHRDHNNKLPVSFEIYYVSIKK